LESRTDRRLGAGAGQADLGVLLQGDDPADAVGEQALGFGGGEHAVFEQLAQANGGYLGDLLFERKRGEDGIEVHRKKGELERVVGLKVGTVGRNHVAIPVER